MLVAPHTPSISPSIDVDDALVNGNSYDGSSSMSNATPDALLYTTGVRTPWYYDYPTLSRPMALLSTSWDTFMDLVVEGWSLQTSAVGRYVLGDGDGAAVMVSGEQLRSIYRRTLVVVLPLLLSISVSVSLFRYHMNVWSKHDFIDVDLDGGIWNVSARYSYLKSYVDDAPSTVTMISMAITSCVLLMGVAVRRCGDVAAEELFGYLFLDLDHTITDNDGKATSINLMLTKIKMAYQKHHESTHACGLTLVLIYVLSHCILPHLTPLFFMVEILVECASVFAVSLLALHRLGFRSLVHHMALMSNPSVPQFVKDFEFSHIRKAVDTVLDAVTVTDSDESDSDNNGTVLNSDAFPDLSHQSRFLGSWHVRCWRMISSPTYFWSVFQDVAMSGRGVGHMVLGLWDHIRIMSPSPFGAPGQINRRTYANLLTWSLASALCADGVCATVLILSSFIIKLVFVSLDDNNISSVPAWLPLTDVLTAMSGYYILRLSESFSYCISGPVELVTLLSVIDGCVENSHQMSKDTVTESQSEKTRHGNLRPQEMSPIPDPPVREIEPVSTLDASIMFSGSPAPFYPTDSPLSESPLSENALCEAPITQFASQISDPDLRFSSVHSSRSDSDEEEEPLQDLEDRNIFFQSHHNHDHAQPNYLGPNSPQGQPDCPVKNGPITLPAIPNPPNVAAPLHTNTELEKGTNNDVTQSDWKKEYVPKDGFAKQPLDFKSKSQPIEDSSHSSHLIMGHKNTSSNPSLAFWDITQRDDDKNCKNGDSEKENVKNVNSSQPNIYPSQIGLFTKGSNVFPDQPTVTVNTSSFNSFTNIINKPRISSPPLANMTFTTASLNKNIDPTSNSPNGTIDPLEAFKLAFAPKTQNAKNSKLPNGFGPDGRPMYRR